SVLCIDFLFMYLYVLRSRLSSSFPYTSLLRSVGVVVSGVLVRKSHVSVIGLRIVATRSRHPFRASLVAKRISYSVFFGGRGRLRDRKSTRLNSSHVSISYAVFCLKKKNEIDNS